jgi:hypothetical protein
MMDPTEKKEILDAINNSHQATYRAFHELFENSIKGFSEQLGQFEERNSQQHHNITTRQDITNGRVNKIESETAVIRWCARNPKVAVIGALLLFIGVIALGIVVGLDNLLNMLP